MFSLVEGMNEQANELREKGANEANEAGLEWHDDTVPFS